jgi:hypothetical protein
VAWKLLEPENVAPLLKTQLFSLPFPLLSLPVSPIVSFFIVSLCQIHVCLLPAGMFLFPVLFDYKSKTVAVQCSTGPYNFNSSYKPGP